MTWSSKVLPLVTCVALAACSGGYGSSGARDKPVADAGNDSGNLTVPKIPGQTILPGEEVDLDGDGLADGVAIDADGDGIADGIDVDGDGIIDVWFPVDGDGGTSVITFPTDPTGSVLCGGVPCQCNDGIDNNGNGLIDLADPNCVSSWDNDEGSLGTGISGDNKDEACQDCFFDGNSGSGDDGCRIPTSCILEGNNSSGRGNCSKCEQSDQCKNFCEAYTPNGCDCFGCCGILVGDTVQNLLLQDSCKIDGTTLTGCTECVPSTTCVNTCGRCELCPGKTVEDLPADCFTAPPPDGTDGGTAPPPYTCDNGGTVCGSGLPECPQDSLCQYGCCVLVPILI